MNYDKGFDEVIVELFGSRISDDELRARVNKRIGGSTLFQLMFSFPNDIANATRLLVEYGADPNGVDDCGGTNLSTVLDAYSNFDEKVCPLLDLLISRGVDLEKLFPTRRLGVNFRATPLEYAYDAELVQCAQKLIRHGANLWCLPLYTTSTRQAQIIDYVDVIKRRIESTRQACCALWTLQWIPHDLRRILMRQVWAERRNEKWG